MLDRILKRLPLNFYPYVQYMHRRQVIFIHIPKNAGSSVLKLLGSNDARWHTKWNHYRRASYYFFNKYHKFAIVRHPLDRLYSCYRYCIKGGNQLPDDLALKNCIDEKSSDFNSFILNVLDSELLMREIIFQPQYLYVFDKSLTCQVDTLLRYETLSSDWKDLAKTLNLPSNLPWVNASRPQEQREKDNQDELAQLALCDEAKEKVNELYRLDFTLFDYR